MVKAEKIALQIIEWFIGLTAVAGGIGLIATNGLGMPVSNLARSPFNSYIWPGIILAVIVGGTHIWAAISNLKKSQIAPEASATAAFGILIWVYTELYIIVQPHWLQTLYFALGIISLVLLLHQLRPGRK